MDLLKNIQNITSTALETISSFDTWSDRKSGAYDAIVLKENEWARRKVYALLIEGVANAPSYDEFIRLSSREKAH